MKIYLYTGEHSKEGESEQLIKSAVRDYLDEPLIEPIINRTSRGKPYFENINVNFSISHTNNIWACLISDFNVGLDLQLDRKLNYLGIAERFFSKEEQEYISKFGESAFFEIWTCKEAYVKYTGNGFANEGFQSFSVVSNHEIINELFRNPECLKLYNIGDLTKCKQLKPYINNEKKLYCAVCSNKEEDLEYRIMQKFENKFTIKRIGL